MLVQFFYQVLRFKCQIKLQFIDVNDVLGTLVWTVEQSRNGVICQDAGGLWFCSEKGVSRWFLSLMLIIVLNKIIFWWIVFREGRLHSLITIANVDEYQFFEWMVCDYLFVFFFVFFVFGEDFDGNFLEPNIMCCDILLANIVFVICKNVICRYRSCWNHLLASK